MCPGQRIELSDYLQSLDMRQVHVLHTAINILLTKTTAPLNEAALSYHKVRGLCFVAVVFVISRKIATQCKSICCGSQKKEMTAVSNDHHLYKQETPKTEVN